MLSTTTWTPKKSPLVFERTPTVPEIPISTVKRTKHHTSLLEAARRSPVNQVTNRYTSQPDSRVVSKTPRLADAMGVVPSS